ncbi:hypothetical protein BB558_003751 [Smittium angustum]|nr:hypothetical protein BB558_003751 [Smittium angustum]
MLGDKLGSIEKDIYFFDKLNQVLKTDANLRKRAFGYEHRKIDIIGLKNLTFITINDLEHEFLKKESTTFGAFSDYNIESSGIPSYSILEKTLWALVHSELMAMMPARIPLILTMFKQKTIPKYFLYSIMASGLKYVDTDRGNKEFMRENKYAVEACTLLKEHKNISDPYYIWTHLILSSYFLSMGMMELSTEYNRKGIDTAINSKYNHIDIPRRVNRLKETEDEKEMKRRVWWGCYIASVKQSLSTGVPLRIKVCDVVVSLPKNDFIWKYGGEIENASNLTMLMNKLAKENGKEILDLQKFCSSMCRMYMRYQHMIFVVSPRCLSKPNDDVAKENELEKVEKSLKDSRAEIEMQSNLNFVQDQEVSIDNYEEPVGFTKLLLALNRFHFRLAYYSSMIYFKFSDLVRVPGKELPGLRVIEAKRKCIKYALYMVDLLKWGYKNIPLEYWDTNATMSFFCSGVVFINAQYIKDHPEIESIKEGLEMVLRAFKGNAKCIWFSLRCIDLMENLVLNRVESNEHNSKQTELIPKMEEYALTPMDHNPWLVHRYLIFKSVECCKERSFSCLYIEDYLGVNGKKREIES